MTEPPDHQKFETGIPSLRHVKTNSTAELIVMSVLGLPAVAFICWLPLLLLLFLPGDDGRTVPKRSACMNNLKQIALALHNYHDKYDSLPPAYVADEQGRPMHSWRALILEFIDEKPLYDHYRFDEPWNGPNNRKVGEYVLPIFQCPSEYDESSNKTNYVVVVGPNTAWPGSKSVSFSDIKDGPSNTILLVEVAGDGISWIEPRDLSVDQMPMMLNSPTKLSISSHHKGGAQAAFCDTRIKLLKDDLPPETLRRLLEINDGEEIGDY